MATDSTAAIKALEVKGILDAIIQYPDEPALRWDMSDWFDPCMHVGGSPSSEAVEGQCFPLTCQWQELRSNNESCMYLGKSGLSS